MRDRLLGALIGLARATEGNEHLISDSSTAVITEALAAVNTPDDESLEKLLRKVEEEKRKMVPNCFCCASPCGRTSACDLKMLQQEESGTQRLKQQLLTKLTQGACKDPKDLYTALIAVGIEGIDSKILESILQKF